jgi:hypothetical protein
LWFYIKILQRGSDNFAGLRDFWKCPICGGTFEVPIDKSRFGRAGKTCTDIRLGLIAKIFSLNAVFMIAKANISPGEKHTDGMDHSKNGMLYAPAGTDSAAGSSQQNR